MVRLAIALLVAACFVLFARATLPSCASAPAFSATTITGDRTTLYTDRASCEQALFDPSNSACTNYYTALNTVLGDHFSEMCYLDTFIANTDAFLEIGDSGPSVTVDDIAASEKLLDLFLDPNAVGTFETRILNALSDVKDSVDTFFARVLTDLTPTNFAADSDIASLRTWFDTTFPALVTAEFTSDSSAVTTAVNTLLALIAPDNLETNILNTIQAIETVIATIPPSITNLATFSQAVITSHIDYALSIPNCLYGNAFRTPLSLMLNSAGGITGYQTAVSAEVLANIQAYAAVPISETSNTNAYNSAITKNGQARFTALSNVFNNLK